MLFNPDLSPLTAKTLFADNTKSLATWDSRFAALHAFASRFVRVPTAILTRSRELDVLAQHVGNDVPTVAVYPHRCMAKQARHLATTHPWVWNTTSGDLRAMDTYLSWTRGPFELVLPESVLTNFIVEQSAGLLHGARAPDAAECGQPMGHIAFVFVTPSTTAMQLLAVDDDLLTSLQGAGGCSGLNYEPWRVNTEQQMAAAEHRGPSYFDSQFSWDGRMLLDLGICTYRLDGAK